MVSGRRGSEETALEPSIPLDYGHILDALADPVIAADASQCVTYANRAMERLLGWSRDDLIGQPLLTIIPERFREQHVAGFTRFIRTGRPTIIGRPIRVPALARDGKEVDIELALSAFPLPDGAPLVIASLRDLRERVELERQLTVTRYLRSVTAAAAHLTSLLNLDRVLQEAAEVLVADFDAALARIWLCDPAENVLHLRASAGLSREITASSRAHIDITTYPYKLAEVARRRVPFVQNGLRGDPQFEQDWVTREGIESVAVFPLLYGGDLLGVLTYFSRHPLPDELVEVLAAFVAISTTAVHDVRLFEEERRTRREAELAEARSMFLAEVGTFLASSLDYDTTLANVADLAVESLADWCLVDVLEEDGELRRLALAHANPELVSVVEEIQRRYPSERSPERTLQVMQTGQAVMVPEIGDEQLVASARDPEHLALIRSLQPLSYMCVPMIGYGGPVGAITMLTSRESGRIYDEDDLTLAEDLARRAAVAVDNARLYRQVQDAIRVRDEFLSTVSHDLKNPLATIKARAQMLRRQTARLQSEDAPRLADGLDSIDTAAGKMARLIDDLVDLAHLRIGRPLTLRYEAADLVRLVGQVTAEQQTALGRTIRSEYDVPSLMGDIDTARIERVLTNLLSNAVKYSAPGTEILVRVGREETAEGANATISVTDQGIGIPANDLPHVFERFYRASNTSEVTGTGIGLAGSLQIVEQHGGSITVESQEGVGTTFTVHLPLVSRGSNDPHGS